MIWLTIDTDYQHHAYSQSALHYKQAVHVSFERYKRLASHQCQGVKTRNYKQQPVRVRPFQSLFKACLEEYTLSWSTLSLTPHLYQTELREPYFAVYIPWPRLVNAANFECAAHGGNAPWNVQMFECPALLAKTLTRTTLPVNHSLINSWVARASLAKEKRISPKTNSLRGSASVTWCDLRDGTSVHLAKHKILLGGVW